MLQYVAAQERAPTVFVHSGSVLKCVAMCCSVLQLQCVAVCCSVLQCCRVLQCVAVCCSAGACTYCAAKASVLQCVAVCRSVFT